MDRYDVLGAIGLLMVTAGLYFVYMPLALIVPGAAVFAIAVAGAARRGRN